MRVAYVINSLEGGGAALPAAAVTDVIRRTGAEVRLFALTRRDGRALPKLEAAKLDVVVREGGEKDHAAATAWLNRHVRDWRPTHIWTSLTRATLLGQVVGSWQCLPVVSWQHAAYLKPANRRILSTTQRLSRLWVADSDRVTQWTADRLGIDRDRLITWPIFQADRSAVRAKAWQPGQPVRIGSLGRLHSVKGYDVLIEALARLQTSTPHEVIIGGAGSQFEELEARARQLAVTNLRFLGYTADPAEFLASLHLYVQPSRSEGFCVAAHEAMQAGLPVIGSTVGEMTNSVLAGQTGWTVPPADADALAAALDRALANPLQLAVLGEAARERVCDLYSSDRFESIGRSIVDRMRAF